MYGMLSLPPSSLAAAALPRGKPVVIVISDLDSWGCFLNVGVGQVVHSPCKVQALCGRIKCGQVTPKQKNPRDSGLARY